ncbi:hypothetical protein [Streptomyces hawaiiensis]|uniref:hypothetical protein n=1 Tax=Streptomyces hawaiiensis TaxID=67305 RepID=UPI003664CD44
MSQASGKGLGGGAAAKATYARDRTGSRQPTAASAPRATPGTTTTLSDTEFAIIPGDDRHFEDYVPGAVYVCGSSTRYDALWVSPHPMTPQGRIQVADLARGAVTVFRARQDNLDTELFRNPV